MSKISFNLKDLNEISLKTWTCLIATLLALSFAAYMGANVNVNVSLEARLNAVERQLERELNSSFYGLQKPASYIISQVGSYTCLQNGTTGKLDDYSTNAADILQHAINNGDSSEGNTIFIKEGFETAVGSEVVINKSRVSLMTGLYRGEHTPKSVYVRKLVIDSQSGQIIDVYLQGIYLRQLILNATYDNPITQVKVEDCCFRTSDDATYNSSIWFTGNSYIMEVRFVDCRMYDHNQYGWGMVRFDNNVSRGGTAQIYFDRCSCQTKDPNCVNFMFDNATAVVSLNEYSYEEFHSGCKFVHLKADSTVYFDVANSWIECTYTITLITIDSGTNMAFGSDWINTLISDKSGTTTFINNQCSSWESDNMGFTILGGEIVGGAANNFQIGTTGASSSFSPRVSNLRNYNPIGYIANPVSGSYLVDSGSGTIANDTQYTCSESAKTVYVSGSFLNIYVNGQLVFSIKSAATVHLKCGDTFEIEWSSPPTIKVMGE